MNPSPHQPNRLFSEQLAIDPRHGSDFAIPHHLALIYVQRFLLTPVRGLCCRAGGFCLGCYSKIIHQKGLVNKVVFGAYQPTVVTSEHVAPEDELITDKDSIIDQPDDPAEDETATDEEGMSRIFLPLVVWLGASLARIVDRFARSRHERAVSWSTDEEDGILERDNHTIEH